MIKIYRHGELWPETVPYGMSSGFLEFENSQNLKTPPKNKGTTVPVPPHHTDYKLRIFQQQHNIEPVYQKWWFNDRLESGTSPNLESAVVIIYAAYRRHGDF